MSIQFPATPWSAILKARLEGNDQSREALTRLCEAYWHPLYVFLRAGGQRSEDAKDLVQGFFARFLERDYLQGLDPSIGKFRSYLLGALKHYVSNERERANARKRGGGIQPLPFEIDIRDDEGPRYAVEPPTSETAETVYERQWAMSVLNNVIERLGKEYGNAGKGESYRHLSAFLPGALDPISYEEAAKRCAISIDAVRSAIHRLRQRYREVLRFEISQTVSHVDEVDGEIRFLMEVIGR